MNKNFVMLSDDFISDDVKKMINQSSRFKKEIFDAVLRADKIDSQIAASYLSFINSLLLKWEEIGNNIKDAAERVDGNSVVNTSFTVIDYNDAKQYIYANYDYASVLQFIDGVIKMSDKEDTTADDIDDYFESVVDKAFRERATTTAGLLNEVLSTNMNYQNATKSDASYFNTTKKYKFMNTRDRVELYKAITKCVEFLGNEKNVSKYFKQPDGADGVNTLIQSIFDSVEYITYSVVAYITRIYALWNYYGRYIVVQESRPVILPLPESKEINLPDIDKEKIEQQEIDILRTYEDDKIKNYAKSKETLQTFESFVTMIGAGVMLLNKDGSQINVNTMGFQDYHLFNNSYGEKLEGNVLFQFIVNQGMVDNSYNPSDSDSELIAFHDRLKDLMYNSKQHLLDTNSSKQELLQVIRGINYDLKTVDCCRKDAVDLYKFAIQTLMKLSKMVYRKIEHHETAANPNGFDPFIHDTTMSSLSSDTIRILSELYSEIAIAIFEKGRDIEKKYNSIRVTENDKLMNSFKINIGTNDKNTTTNINNAVPDTTRMPVDISNLYKIPSYESAAAYDDYLFRTNELYNEAFYYAEGIDFTKWKNNITAWLKSLWASMKDFINNSSFKRAVKWVTDHENDLKTLNLAGAEMEVLPYMTTVVEGKEQEALNIGSVYTHLINGLNAFNIDNIKTMDDVTTFAKTLYPSEDVYDMFKTDKNASTKFVRSICFNKQDLPTNPEDPVRKIKIDANGIRTHLDWWIKTIKGANEAYQSIDAKNKQISQANDKIQAQLASAVNRAKTQANNANNNQQQSQQQAQGGFNVNGTSEQQPPAITNPNNNQNNNQSAKTESVWFEDTTPDNTSNLVNTIESEINNAMQKLCGSMKDIFIEYHKNEYGYIQEAYKLGTANQQQTTTQQNTQQQNNDQNNNQQ